jgi:cytidine deaminase
MMKKEEIRISYQVFSAQDELPPFWNNLYLEALKGHEVSYAPYSRFKVGAAVALDNDQLLHAGNVENAAYPMCLCAERTLLAAVDSQFPDAQIMGMAITVDTDGVLPPIPAAPCGACRQVLAEKEDRTERSIPLLLRGQTGPFYLFDACRDLLPLAFSGQFLGQ